LQFLHVAIQRQPRSGANSSTCGDSGWTSHALKRLRFTSFLALALVLLAATAARAQDDPLLEEAYRAYMLQTLPTDAAQRLFSAAQSPAQLPPQAIGAYGRGCLAGAVPLGLEGPGWIVMRPSRGRNFGHPKLVAWIEAYAARAQEDGLPEILVGDMAQPRGGPMITGHSSHQLGLEVDIWLTHAPADEPLSPEERNDLPSVEMVRPDLLEVYPDRFTPAQLSLLRLAALMPDVDRIFVNAAIKRVACREATERVWLRKLRPWQGHTHHFHVALTCPNRDCVPRNPVPAGDGCGKELDHWLRKEVRFPKPEPRPRPARHAKLGDLPRACRSVLAAP
jgi:penicillin-insensitive murein endopeptidase